MLVCPTVNSLVRHLPHLCIAWGSIVSYLTSLLWATSTRVLASAVLPSTSLCAAARAVARLSLSELHRARPEMSMVGWPEQLKHSMVGVCSADARESLGALQLGQAMATEATLRLVMTSGRRLRRVV